MVKDIVQRSTVPCHAIGMTLTMKYGANAMSTVDPDASIIGHMGVTSTVDGLEDNPTEFDLVLNTCEAAEPLYAVVSPTLRL